MTSSWVLAIDFGTTNTVAATAPLDGSRGAELLRLGDNYRMPSAVMLAEDGSLVVGPRLEQEAELSPDRVARRLKRQLGDDDVYIGGDWRPPAALVAAILRYVFTEACRLHNHQPPVLTRLTHPVRWQDTRLNLLRDVAQQAGVAQVELMPEPIAAAVALARRHRLADVPIGARVAVYDFGGGTLDTAVLERTRQGFRLCGPPGGDEHLGGEDIDDKLAGFLSAQLPDHDRESLFNLDIGQQPQAWRRAAYQYANQVRKAKEALVERRTQRVPLMSPPLSVPYLELAEADLSTVVGATVRTSLDRLETNLQRVGVAPEELAAVFLVGGSSRLAIVQRLLGPRFGVPVAIYGDPKGLVPLGAAELGMGDVRRPTFNTRRPEDSSADGDVNRIPLPGPSGGTSTVSPPGGGKVIGDAGRALHEELLQRAREYEGRYRPQLQAMVQQRVGKHAPGGEQVNSPMKTSVDARVQRCPSATKGAEPNIGRVYTVPAAESQPFNALTPAHTASLNHWKVAPGNHVLIGQPLVSITAMPGNICADLGSQYAGTIRTLRHAEGATVSLTEPLLELHAVTAFLLRRGRVAMTDSGVALAVEAAPARIARDPASLRLLVHVAGRVERLWWGNSFFFPLPPGIYTLVIDYPLEEGRRGGVASRLIQIQPAQRIALSYCAARIGHGPGRLTG